MAHLQGLRYRLVDEPLAVLAAAGFDIEPAWKTVRSMLEEFWATLPRLIAACVVFALFYGLGRVLLSLSSRMARRSSRSLYVGRVIGKLLQVAAIIVGILAGLAVVLPSFRAGDLIQLLGIGSVAVGFAFRDVLQNFLAGIILLLDEQFRIGDEIEVSGQRGRVEDIQVRATLLRAEDGRKVVIPNATLFVQTVLVKSTETSGPEAEKAPTEPGQPRG